MGTQERTFKVRRVSSGPMTVTEFAAAIGITPNGVRKAIKTGRISAEAIERGDGKPPMVVDPVLAATSWAERTGTPRGSRSIDYESLPEGLKRARMVRDLRAAAAYEMRAKAEMRRAAAKSGVRPVTSILAALAVARSQVKGRDASRLVNIVKKELEL